MLSLTHTTYMHAKAALKYIYFNRRYLAGKLLQRGTLQTEENNPSQEPPRPPADNQPHTFDELYEN